MSNELLNLDKKNNKKNKNNKKVITKIRFLLQASGQLLETEFQPTVTATCNSGYMTIRVNLNQSFTGAVHARDYRTPQCMTPGDGSNHVTLGINLFAPHDAPDYCGVLINNVCIC